MAKLRGTVSPKVDLGMSPVARFQAQDPRAAAFVRLGDSQQEKSKNRCWSLVITNTLRKSFKVLVYSRGWERYQVYTLVIYDSFTSNLSDFNCFNVLVALVTLGPFVQFETYSRTGQQNFTRRRH